MDRRGLEHGDRRFRSRHANAYWSWRCMWQRCTQESHAYFDNYGGRGVWICEEWQSFERFFEDMGDREDGLTLDRIDSDGPYCKSNCKWSNRVEQARNTRSYRSGRGKKLGQSARKEAAQRRRFCDVWKLCGTLWAPSHVSAMADAVRDDLEAEYGEPPVQPTDFEALDGYEIEPRWARGRAA